MATTPKVLEIFEVVAQGHPIHTATANQFRGLDVRAQGSDHIVRIIDDDGRISVHLFSLNYVIEGSMHFDHMPPSVIAAAILRLLEES